MVIPHQNVIGTDQTNFPVLISVTLPSLKTVSNGGNVQNVNGYDIVFTSDAAGQNQLSHEIGSYNPITGAATFWVAIPTLSHTTDTTLFMWYGSSAVQVSQENKAGVWANGYVGVWHLTSDSSDSSANEIHGSDSNVAYNASAGRLGGGASFSGNSIISFGNNSLYNVADNVSLSAWVQPARGGFEGIISRAQQNSPSGWGIYEAQNNNFNFNLFSASGTGLNAQSDSAGVVGAWTHLEAVRANGVSSLFVNGVQQYQVGLGVPDTSAADQLLLGTAYSDVSSGNFVGSMNDVMISFVAHSADWIATEYINQSSPASFTIACGEQTAGSTLIPCTQQASSLPTITGLTPTSGSTGTAVAIMGSGFGQTQGSGIVLFNGLTAGVGGWSDTQINAIVPSYATTGPVVVYTGTERSNSNFVFTIPEPVVGSVAPSVGPVGTQIVISGIGFGSSMGSSTVSLGGTSVSVSSWADTQIVGVVPVSTGFTQAIQVNVGGVGSNTNVTFTVPPPVVAGVTPSSGPVGTQITITGTGFVSTQRNSIITLGGTQLQVASWSDTQIVATVPLTAGLTKGVQVTVNGMSSNANVTFAVTPPHVTAISPVSGVAGTVITINGTNFTPIQGQVAFNGVLGSILSWNDTQIVAVVPPAAASGQAVPVTVCANSAWSNANVSFSMSSPVVTGTTPNSGAVGTQVTINGTGFGQIQGSSIVTFNGISANVSNWSNTLIVAAVPAGAKSGPVAVLVGGGSGLSSNATVTFTMPSPAVSSLNPASGASSSQIAINGSGYGAVQGNSTVLFGSTVAPVISWSDTQIIASAPPVGASTQPVPVQIVEGGVPSNTNVSFTYTYPHVASVSPTTGVVGTLITISGTGFGASQGSGFLTINGIYASASSWSDTAIRTTVPSGAKTGSVIVTVGGSNGLASNNNVVFTMPNPVVNALTPAIGTASTQVTVTGSGFGASQGSSTVIFNGVSASVISWNDSSIVVTAPSAAAGTSPVAVQVIEGGVGSNSGNTFEFIAPQVVSLSPTSGVYGTAVTINGTGFGSAQGNSTVRFNGVGANISSWSGTQIQATVPNNAATGPVTVTLGGGLVSNNNVVFTLPNPVVGSIAPTTGPVGTQVTITGSGFGTTCPSVTFNNIAATAMNCNSTSITAIVPKVSPYPEPVQVAVSGVVSNSNIIFTTPYPQISGLGPTTGIAGTQVTVTGSSFGALQGTVILNGTSASILSWADTQIVITVPSNTASGPVAVTVLGVGASVNNPVFTVPGPVVGSITPNNGMPGTGVTIFGSGFGATQGTSILTFNGLNATSITSWSDTQIVAVVPSNTETGPVLVKTFAGASNNNVIFTVPTPVISGITPTGGSAGTQVTITGTGFGATQGNGSVRFTGSSSATIISWSDAQVVATTPAGTQTGPVVVLGPTGTSNNNVLFTVPAPIVSSISPTTGAVGSQIAIAGSGFSAYSGTVQMNGNNASIVSWTDSQIVAVVPSTAVSTLPVPVQVIVSGVGSNKDQTFTVVPPSITAIYPTSGVIGTQITITGTGFGTSQGSGVVTFNDVSATQVAWSSNQIIASVPSGAKTGPVLVIVGSPNGLASNNNFVLSLPNPVISSVSPASGIYGAQVTVTGSGFGNTQGSIAFNGIPSTVQSWSDGQITTSVPTGASTGPILVNIGGVNSNGASFVVPTPQITGISPTSGPTGTQVIITGANFGQNTGSVTFNQTPANVSSWTSTQIIATVPSTAISGPVVVNVGGIASNSDQVFTVPPPAVTSVNPTNGIVGTQVTITGTSFGSAGYAKFNGVDAAVVSWSDTEVVAIVQPGARTGPVDITVNGVDSNQDVQFTMPNPTVTALSPTSGPVATQVTVTGIGFGDSQGSNTIGFNGPTPATVTSWSDTQIVTAVPPGSVTGQAVVTVGGVASNTGPVFTIPPPQISSFAPTTGLPGQQVTIVGSGFDSEEGESFVTFNGVPAETVSWTDTMLVVTVPTNSSTGSLGVWVKGAVAQGGQFTVGLMNTVVTNSLGGSTTYQAGIFGSALGVFEADGPGCSTCTFRGHLQNIFDGNGNILTSIDSLGHTTTYTYDSSNNVTSVSQQLSDGTPVTNSYTYNSFGEVLTSTDPLGNVTTNTYDGSGNLFSVALPSPDGSTASSVTNFTYDQYGELTTILDPLGHETDIAYNAGLVSTITTHPGGSANYVTSYGYDSHGNRTSVTDASGNITQFTYDAGDRLIGITYPDGTTAGFGYDYRGRRTSSTDQNGMTTNYGYDDADRLISVTDAARNTTSYSYDTENNLISITDANGNMTTFTYDAFARVIETTFPSSLVESYTYDAIGNLLSKTDRKGQMIDYVYDALNRLVQKTYPAGGGSVEYVYDLVGKVLKVTDPTGTYSFAYDNMGRLIGTTTSYAALSGQSFNNSYTYDADSNRTSFTGPDGSTNTYTYDALNHLTGIANTWAGTISMQYDALSRRTSLGRPNGVNTTYQYDSLSHLLNVLHSNTSDGENYTYDSAGNRTSKQNLLSGTTENYSYDKLYQLTQVLQGANTTENYTYDTVGNRLSAAGFNSLSYNSSNELLTSPTTSFTYDSNGNMISKTITSTNATTSYAWDFENRLTKVTLPGTSGTISFIYDPFGRRIQKTSASGATIYLYDGANIVAEVNPSGAIQASYVQSAGIDEPLAMRRGGNIAYYQADGLGSITSLTDSTAKTISTYVYKAFGSTTAAEGIFNPFRYTAREQDPETGLYYYRARYYDPNIGRFISEDPFRFKVGIDFYTYTGNNPVTFLDPLGLSKCYKTPKGMTCVGDPPQPPPPPPGLPPMPQPVAVPPSSTYCAPGTNCQVTITPGLPKPTYGDIIFDPCQGWGGDPYQAYQGPTFSCSGNANSCLDAERKFTDACRKAGCSAGTYNTFYTGAVSAACCVKK